MAHSVFAPPAMTGEGPPRRERGAHLRLMFFALSVSLWALVIGLRLVHLQVLERDFFVKEGTRQSERTIKLDPRRGPIFDRGGRALAVSVDAESLYAVPENVDDPQATATSLARALGMSPADRRELVAKLRKDRAFVWVERKVDPGTARRVRELVLDGVGFLTEHRRYYPQRELAAHVLGWAGLDNTGMSGVEYSFEEHVAGRAAKVVVHTDARRRPVGHTERPSTDGHALVLALDERIQHIAERELERSMSETRAVAGSVIVVEPFSGDVLAMAGRPTFNPNRYSAYSASRWRNRMVSDVFEPGSIFKIITAAAGIQEAVVDPDEVLDCGNGLIRISRTVIHDHKAFDKLSFREAVARSSDIGMIRVAQRLGRENFYRYVRGFGFGEPTGVDLPGESGGLLKPTARWSELSLPSMSFGQEVGVTPLQMVMAAGAVANGGYLMKPLIVKRIEDVEGNLVKERKPVIVRRVLEPDTVDTLTEMLKMVVREGTGRRAALSGYVVAGKTGTAQKIDKATGRYSMVDHVASFVGFVPASRPALVILASLDTPRGARNQGGDVAAPLFGRVARHALRALAVPPDDHDRVLRAVAVAPETLVPAAYRPAAARRPLPPLTDDPGIMPDLAGRSAREAAIAAARQGLVVELSGSGRVVEQTPAPGTVIQSGHTCRLVLSRTGGAP